MKQRDDFHKLLLILQILSGFILATIVGLTVWQITKIRIPEISDREIIFWLTEIE